ncbi:odorant receptor 46a-like [Metopolophium dirhodum]|uniref:odorant receptor 46a-like n=1 Tax=Metopolophium dirhodum TaxID=44670 RepID=UPI0029901753|nr:odorant receptor 46a-like [Metopolophium dirhodum]
MDIQNEKNHIFNIKFTKLIGLYQMVDPKSIKLRGGNIYHVVMWCVMLYVFIVSMILVLSGLYYWTVNIPISMDYIWKSVTTFYITYKTWLIMRHSNDIWNCLSITRYDFTSFSNRNKHVLDHWRERLTWFMTMYTIMYFTAVVSSSVTTLAFSGVKLPVKNHEGSVGYYRLNILNFYLIASDDTYNSHYNKFYFFETLSLIVMTMVFLVFDMLLVTLCFGMCCQMEMISSAFESVGHKSLRDQHSSIDSTDENENKSSNDHDLIYYEELKTIIMDHQVLMKKYEDFLTLFRRVMLLHLFVSSFSVIMLCLTVIMSFSSDDRFKTSDVIVEKMICSIPSIFFQIYMVCYLFGSIHAQKDSIIFALYSSNWTEMDMKCKQLILLTMILNNTNHKMLKFTRTKIVNLEMFFKIMGDCYTVISVLVNYIQTKNE